MTAARAARRVAALLVVGFATVPIHPPVHASGPPSIDDPVELVAFVDGRMSARRPAYDGPGAAVAIVTGGEPLLVEGYGHADAAGPTPLVLVHGVRFWRTRRAGPIARLHDALVAVVAVATQGQVSFWNLLGGPTS